MNALLHDNLSGVRQIKSFVREQEHHARFNRVSDQLRRATLVVMRVWAIYSPSMSMFEAIGAVLLLRVRQSRRFDRRNANWRSCRVPYAHGISLRSDQAVAPA